MQSETGVDNIKTDISPTDCESKLLRDTPQCFHS